MVKVDCEIMIIMSYFLLARNIMFLMLIFKLLKRKTLKLREKMSGLVKGQKRLPTFSYSSYSKHFRILNASHKLRSLGLVQS